MIEWRSSPVTAAVWAAASVTVCRDGDNVVVADLNLETAQATVEVVEKNDRQGLALVADVASEEACRNLVAQVLEAFGQIDIIVNNAGHSGGKLALPLPIWTRPSGTTTTRSMSRGPKYRRNKGGMVSMAKDFGFDFRLVLG
jgi:NAD(P)-dependent dehydrogenase (short-subunit alcohol dehydrogenase family)